MILSAISSGLKTVSEFLSFAKEVDRRKNTPEMILHKERKDSVLIKDRFEKDLASKDLASVRKKLAE